MTTIRFRPAKLAFAATGSGLAALWFGSSLLGEFSWLDALGAACFGYLTVVMARCALGDRSALKFDEQGITINTYQRSATLRWDEVRDIVIERVTLRWLYLIPVSAKEHIAITTRGGAFSGKRYRLAGSLIELPPGGMMELHSRLCAAKLAATGNAIAAPNPAPASESGTEFDPGAAIARYLAAKQAGLIEPTGRPAVPATPIVHASARPVFGRRTS